MVNVLRTPEDATQAANSIRSAGKRVGFVPTMGALHEGHLALVRKARELADDVMVSIFVNPTQFGPNEDFAKYPRDLDGDVKKVASAGATMVFAPESSAMYPEGEKTRVRVAGLDEHLCGPFRPGHFEGVATIVAKLFAIVGPSVALFGRKDFQQLAILRRMVKDLFLPIEIVGYPIVREKDGLALSSRNAYLSPDERQRALSLSRGLFAAARAFDAGQKRAGHLVALCESDVVRGADTIDYVTLADADSLIPFADGETIERGVLAIAARIGKTRLIDNFVLGEDRAQ